MITTSTFCTRCVWPGTVPCWRVCSTSPPIRKPSALTRFFNPSPPRPPMSLPALSNSFAAPTTRPSFSTLASSRPTANIPSRRPPMTPATRFPRHRFPTPRKPASTQPLFTQARETWTAPSASFSMRLIATASPASPLNAATAARLDKAGFHSSARNLDRAVGQILDALDRNGLTGNTLVISTTDHGVAFPLMKCNLEDNGWGVSLIMRGPGGFSGGKVIDALISHLDIYPTLCDLAAVAHPAWLEGKSMLPIIRGEANEINDEVFAEVTYHAAYEPKRAVRTGRWKYIRRFGDKHTPVLPNCDDGLSKSVWLEYGWKSMRLPDESLYDLIFDPNEHNNLAADPASKTVLTEMRGRLRSEQRR